MKQALSATLAALACACAQAADPEPPARFALRGFWPDATAITFRIVGDDGPLSKETLREALLDAGVRWGAHAPVALREAAGDETPHVRVSWEGGLHGECPPFGRDTSIAHAGPPSAGTFLHLDVDREWTAAPTAATEAEHVLGTTLLHEVGHLLGLDHGPDPASLMFSDPGATGIARSDRAGIQTLYGGGAPGAADLVVARGDERICVLYGVAPRELADFALFDTDGDGDDELVLWRADEAGQGEIVAFHFAPGPRPERTVGPRPGMVGIGAAVELVATPAGERLLVIEYPNGQRQARAFDERGRIVSWAGAVPAPTVPRSTPVRDGDLDGDGRTERVQRPGEE